MRTSVSRATALLTNVAGAAPDQTAEIFRREFRVTLKRQYLIADKPGRIGAEIVACQPLCLRRQLRDLILMAVYQPVVADRVTEELRPMFHRHRLIAYPPTFAAFFRMPTKTMRQYLVTEADAKHRPSGIEGSTYPVTQRFKPG